MINLKQPTKTIRQLLGPSVVFVALSLNGGEMLLWPDLVAKYGLSILWLVPVILTLQFFTNLEIERFSVVTGKPVLAELTRSSRWLGWLSAGAVIACLAWPAWASIAGNVLAVTVGQKSLGGWISAGFLAILLILWFSEKSYQMMENLAKIGLILVLGIALATIVLAFRLNLTTLPVDQWTLWPKLEDRFLFVSALAYGGVAGVLNLVQSNWIINRRYGVLESLAENQDFTQVDWESNESKSAFQKWWKLVVTEHFLLFLVGNLVGILLISCVAFLTLFGSVEKGLGILSYQINLLNQNYSFLGSLWGIGICLLFLMAQMTILDAAGRLLQQCLNLNLNSDRLSQLVGLAGLVILLIGAIFDGFNQPSWLLQTSALMSALTMSIYPMFLIKLNSTLPLFTRPQLWRKIILVGVSLFYGGMFWWAFLGQI